MKIQFLQGLQSFLIMPLQDQRFRLLGQFAFINSVIHECSSLSMASCEATRDPIPTKPHNYENFTI